MGRINWIQFYCSVSGAMGIEYHRSEDALVKCDAIQKVTDCGWLISE